MSARSKATDRPQSRRRGRSSTRVPQYSADRIKETNPRRVARLWRQVMAPKVSKKLPSNAPPRSRATRSSGLGEEVQSNWSTLPLQDAATNEIQASPSVTQVSTTRTSKSESDKNATAHDADFEDTVKESGRGGQYQQQQPALEEEGDFAVHASVYGKVQTEPNIYN